MFNKRILTINKLEALEAQEALLQDVVLVNSKALLGATTVNQSSFQGVNKNIEGLQASFYLIVRFFFL